VFTTLCWPEVNPLHFHVKVRSSWLLLWLDEKPWMNGASVGQVLVQWPSRAVALKDVEALETWASTWPAATALHLIFMRRSSAPFECTEYIPTMALLLPQELSCPRDIGASAAVQVSVKSPEPPDEYASTIKYAI
jgi:hypothetical protein